MSKTDETGTSYVTGYCDIAAASISLTLSHGFFFGSATDGWYPRSGPTLYVEVLVRECELVPVGEIVIDSTNKTFTASYPAGTTTEALMAALDRLTARCNLICGNDVNRTFRYDPRYEAGQDMGRMILS